ncbi:MAG: chemotaxis protein CheX [Chitinivibrionales bacterium]|nr:chemotaxis protein CheX [Chitinivibrionales bacterium]
MNVAFINPFINATILLFKTMVHLDAFAGKPALKKQPFPAYDVSGIIGLSGDAQGSVAISFPRLVALKVVSAFLGSEIKIMGSEVVDGIGELANIIAGNAKQDLSQYNLSISLPQVVVGNDHVISGQTGIPAIIIPMTCSLGNFAIEISFKTK